MIAPRRGFTIIELLVAITIMLLLIGTVGLSVNNTRKSNRDAKRISDIILIAKAIDGSVLVNNGQYPKNATPGRNNKDMCAHELGSISTNPSSLDFTIFPGQAILKDPHAYSLASSGCTTYLAGYTYHTHYGVNATDSNYTAANSLTYALEVGLEGEKPFDESRFTTWPDLAKPTSSNNRFQYFLQGSYCGTTCYK